VLDGRYRVIGLLGKGGMGEVYRADDLRLGQPVALKFLPDAVGADPVRLAQFHNEVRTARQISHPNICRVYDIGEIDGHLFLSMEYVDGEDLASSLRRIGRFAEDKAVEIARQLCAGLAAAHDRGVLHRDLKPANVMLDDAGKVRLMDFGLAAVGAVEDIRAGTPAYMAPEQLLGREVTARSDIYALGLVIYELFTGRRAFNVSTLNELIEQHQSGTLTAPRDIVAALDPAIERAILRCLDPDPAKRPSSAFAVSAALPGGDPLAAALAAGETPSPEMVAAAGAGTRATTRAIVALLAASLAGMGIAYALALRSSGLEHLRPDLNADILAQKAREALQQLGYRDRPHDEAYGFSWDEALISHVRGDGPPRPLSDIVAHQPSPLRFWYRSSQSPMLGLQFHHDLLTPGIVTRDDPAPLESGMRELTLDHQGRLLAFEAIATQVQPASDVKGAIDWGPLFALAGIDRASLQPTEPEWHWLASADTRVAWTGSWPGGEALRVEAAALDGRPVAFQAVGPWTRPSRTPGPDEPGAAAILVMLFVLLLAVVIGGSVLARKHLREGRGDRQGAQALGSFVAAALWVLWVCQVHVSATVGMLGIVLLVVATTVFYAALFWAIYLALEPFVRRYWPQTLVSWTTILAGRPRDPIVGRDALIGVAIGVVVALLVQISVLVGDSPLWADPQYLDGTRQAAGLVVMQVLYAVRTSLFFFYLIFLFRLLLRREWAAAGAFVLVFTALDVLDSTTPWMEGTTTAAYFSLLAFAVLRWGFTTVTAAILTGNSLLNMPATTAWAGWHFEATVMTAAIPVALALWSFRTAATETRKH
jgi:serine/threonine-protein kinase